MENTPTQEVKFAVFGCTDEITEEMYKEVLEFVEHIRSNPPEKEKNRPSVGALERNHRYLSMLAHLSGYTENHPSR